MWSGSNHQVKVADKCRIMFPKRNKESVCSEFYWVQIYTLWTIRMDVIYLRNIKKNTILHRILTFFFLKECIFLTGNVPGNYFASCLKKRKKIDQAAYLEDRNQQINKQL